MSLIVTVPVEHVVGGFFKTIFFIIFIPNVIIYCVENKTFKVVKKASQSGTGESQNET